MAVLIITMLSISPFAMGSDYLSPLALVADSASNKIYIAEYTARQIAVFDTATETIVQEISLPDKPGGLVLSADGKQLYVTTAISKGQLHIVNLETGKIKQSISVGHSPVAVVLSPDNKLLYICNQFENCVSVINLESRQQVAKISVLREPIAATITPDSRYLFVANLLPAGAADGGYAASAVSVIDTNTQKVTCNIRLPNGSTGLRGICVSPDGNYVYVTHILARYQLPTTQLERGWINTNALSVIDVKKLSLLNTVLLDDVDLGAANPWAVSCNADGKYICVTHSGTHEVSIIDRAGLHDKLRRAALGEKASEVTSSAADVPNDLAFLVGLRRRIKLNGNSPRGLVIVGNTVYVTEYFTDSISIVDIESSSISDARSVVLQTQTNLNKIRQGEMLFYDARLCFQQWQSCASCHPGQGRVDGLNWDLLNDGIGNPKNTKSMLLAHETPPSMVTGIRDNAGIAVRSGIRRILFTERPEEEAQAIDAYLKSLKPLPSPYLEDGELSSAAQRGKAIFKKTNCLSCHQTPLYTDLQKYDVGIGKGLDQQQLFDTPSLIEVWRTAPYLYDGRAATIYEVLTKYNQNDTHGTTSNLNKQELNDLVEFVLSL